MATLPGLPQTDEPEPDALPVEPHDVRLDHVVTESGIATRSTTTP
jgi:5-formyltetrahydrofolate cyclo-ligase